MLKCLNELWQCYRCLQMFLWGHKLKPAELTWSSQTFSPPSPPLTGRVPWGWQGRPSWSASPASVAGGDWLRAAGHRRGWVQRFSSSGQLAGHRWRLWPRRRYMDGTPCRPGTLSHSQGHTRHRRYRWRRSDTYTRRFQGHMTDALFPPYYSHKLRRRHDEFR